jgi:hypothetical protein
MASRNTSTGAVFESTVLPALTHNGYTFATQQVIGLSLAGRKHRADVVIAISEATKIIVSVKWQQVSGSADEKVPYEVIKLIHAVKNSNGEIPYAYIVIAGPGWSSLKEFYLKHGLRPDINDYALVKIVSLDDFIYLANKRVL